MAYEVVMPYHLHMPSYFLETFTEYPYLKRRFFLLLRSLIIVVIALSILGFLLSSFVACWNMKIKNRHYSRLSRDVMWRLTGKIFVMEALL